MNFLDILRNAAAGRTKGRWKPVTSSQFNISTARGPEHPWTKDCGHCVTQEAREQAQEQAKKDANHIATFGNCADEIVAVLEAVSNNPCRHYAEQENCQVCEALTALARKVTDDRG